MCDLGATPPFRSMNMQPMSSPIPTTISDTVEHDYNNGKAAARIPLFVGLMPARPVWTPVGANNNNNNNNNDTYSQSNYDDDDHCGTSCPGNDQSEEINGKNSNWVWSVTLKCVPKVPQHMPLERTAITLDLPLDVVTSKISCFMRINSVSCSYHSQEARVDCFTKCCLKFVVQLWEDDNDKIVLEVQRRRGCSISMRCIRKCLYRSIMAEQMISIAPTGLPRRPPPPSSSSSSPKPSVRPCHAAPAPLPPRSFANMRPLQKQPTSSPPSTPFQELDALRRKRCRAKIRLVCLELLESDKKCENCLGLECLAGLTDPTKVSPSDAEEIARALLYEEGDLAERLRTSFVGYFDSSMTANSPVLAGDDDDGAVDDACCLEFSPSENPEYSVTHFKALKVLVNCLDLVANHEKDYLCNDSSLRMQLASPFWDDIIACLVTNLRLSSQRPQEAALSAQCLRVLNSMEPETLEPLVQRLASTLLMPAYEFGKAHHLSLQKELEGLLSSVGGEEGEEN